MRNANCNLLSFSVHIFCTQSVTVQEQINFLLELFSKSTQELHLSKVKNSLTQTILECFNPDPTVFLQEFRSKTDSALWAQCARYASRMVDEKEEEKWQDIILNRVIRLKPESNDGLVFAFKKEGRFSTYRSDYH
jgi:hypothetical protein